LRKPDLPPENGRRACRSPPASDDRRRFSRIVFHRPADLATRAGQASCSARRLAQGALVEAPVGFEAPVGLACTLTIRLDGAEAVIRMDGEIAHRQGRQVGVRCTEIDLESIAHLRRLVELNVGDDELLHRELSALVSTRP
jgi:hypothetical protein